MARPATAAAAVALLAATLSGAPAGAAEAAGPPAPRAEPPVPLLPYCAPPAVPACLGTLKAHPDALKSCAPRAEAYEASVFAYRLCLTRETERAVREANGAMAKLRCAQGRRC